jgi:SAM-dependent methyltransferase
VTDPDPVTDDQAALLEHYVARGHEAWNTSTEAAWMDYQLRDWIEPLIPSMSPKRVCNVGIGVGLFDDWLGHVIGRADRLISVDVDPEVCRVFALRQARERHPQPSLVVRGDVLAGVLPPAAFDAITLVGTSLDEIGPRHRARAIEALVGALAPGGRLIISELADVVAAPLPDGVVVTRRRHARRGELALALVVIEHVIDIPGAA